MLKNNKDFSITVNTKKKNFKVGNKVLLYLINIKTYQLLKKLNTRYLGFF